MSDDQGRVDELAEAYAGGFNQFFGLIGLLILLSPIWYWFGETGFTVLMIVVFGIIPWIICFREERIKTMIGCSIVAGIILVGGVLALLGGEDEITVLGFFGMAFIILLLGPFAVMMFNVMNLPDDGEGFDFAKKAAGYKGYKDAAKMIKGGRR